MLVVSGLLWLNFNGRSYLEDPDDERHYFGWPFPALLKHRLKGEFLNRDSESRITSVTLVNRQETGPYGALPDLLISLAIVVAVFFTSEWLITRRAARKTS